MVGCALLRDARCMTTDTTTLTPESPAPRRLTRSSGDRVIAGVGGGIGRYLGLDPVLVRIIIVVLAFIGGAGLIGYLAAWILMPLDTAGAEAGTRRATLRRVGTVLGV